MCQSRQFLAGHGTAKALNLKVRGVHLEQHRRLFANNSLIVPQMRPVCGADLNHMCTGKAHNIGNAKGTPYFDQLPAGDNDLSLSGQSSKTKNNGTRIIINDKSRLRSCQLAEQPLHMGIPMTARTRLKRILKGTVPGSHTRHSLNCPFSKTGSPHIGVNDNSGGIDYFNKARKRTRLHPSPRFFNNMRGVQDAYPSGTNTRAYLIHHISEQGFNGLAPQLLLQRKNPWLPQKQIH